MAPATLPDIDRILDAIRNEARSRGARGSVGAYAAEAPIAALAQRSDPGGMPLPEIRHVADLLSLPLDVFLVCAYRRLLGREPDADGLAHYTRVLVRGSLTRIDVLGRFALSPEGRASGLTLEGLMPAFVLATAYRIPLVGPAAALVARVLRFPPHWQDRSLVEAAALATGSWMKR